MKFQDEDHFADDDEHQTKQGKRLLGAIAFAVFFLAVGGLLVTVFIYFTSSWSLAIMLVGFMMLYMTFMGWLAARKSDDKDL